jgi:hypothetical protein
MGHGLSMNTLFSKVPMQVIPTDLRRRSFVYIEVHEIEEVLQNISQAEISCRDTWHDARALEKISESVDDF